MTPVRQESGNRRTDDQNEVTASLSNRIKELEVQLKLKDEVSLRVHEKLSAAEQQVKHISSNSSIISRPPLSQVDTLTTEVLQLQDCLDAVKMSPCKSCSALEHMVGKLEEELSLAKNEIEQMVQSHR